MGIEEFLLERAKKEGIVKGIEKGERKGALEEKRTIAKRLRELDMSLDSISQITGLSMKELKNL